jgi:hypothetical protein
MAQSFMNYLREQDHKMAELKQYEQFDTEFFSVRDTMGVPHPFCIGARHVAYASDNCGGMLGDSAIKASGVPCQMKGCQLSYKEHETALAVNCKSKDNELLKNYLLSIKEQCEKDNYAGFVLVDCT